MSRHRSLLEQSQKTIDSLKESHARHKGELFATDQAKAAHQLVMDYFKPFFDLPLTFKAYGLPEGFGQGPEDGAFDGNNQGHHRKVEAAVQLHQLASS